jgi:hypothetical protein
MTHQIGDTVTIMGKEYEVALADSMTICYGCVFNEDDDYCTTEGCPVPLGAILKSTNTIVTT